MGKILQTQNIELSVRKTQTDIYDTTGQHILWTKSTIVRVDDESSAAIKRDDHGHDEIMNALREERDATPFEEP